MFRKYDVVQMIEPDERLGGFTANSASVLAVNGNWILCYFGGFMKEDDRVIEIHASELRKDDRT